MIGNSPKSDINPAIKLGMYAVFIPYEFTWVLDDEPLIGNRSRLITVQNFSDLKALFA
jgi:putative hydrolase of the HAD superfamily